MELKGKIIAILPKREGEGSRGKWMAQDYVLETVTDYPHKMCFSVYSEEKIQRFAVQMGQVVNVAFDIDAHEYQGRWYNSIRAYDVRLAESAPAPQPAPQPQPNVVYAKDVKQEDEQLPF